MTAHETLAGAGRASRRRHQRPPVLRSTRHVCSRRVWSCNTVDDTADWQLGEDLCASYRLHPSIVRPRPCRGSKAECRPRRERFDPSRVTSATWAMRCPRTWQSLFRVACKAPRNVTPRTRDIVTVTRQRKMASSLRGGRRRWFRSAAHDKISLGHAGMRERVRLLRGHPDRKCPGQNERRRPVAGQAERMSPRRRVRFADDHRAVAALRTPRWNRSSIRRHVGTGARSSKCKMGCGRTRSSPIS
jgi:hypothetical protein